jgi:CHASE3 domain sensor protein
VSGRPADPALLREEVERTREEIVDTINRLHAKANHARQVPMALIAASGVGLLLVIILLLRRR